MNSTTITVTNGSQWDATSQRLARPGSWPSPEPDRPRLASASAIRPKTTPAESTRLSGPGISFSPLND